MRERAGKSLTETLFLAAVVDQFNISLSLRSVELLSRRICQLVDRVPNWEVVNVIAPALETELENQKTKASTGVGTWEALDMVSWTLSLVLEVVEERYNCGFLPMKGTSGDVSRPDEPDAHSARIQSFFSCACANVAFEETRARSPAVSNAWPVGAAREISNSVVWALNWTTGSSGRETQLPMSADLECVH